MRQLLSCALVVALTAGLSAGCGKSAEEKAAEDLKAATKRRPRPWQRQARPRPRPAPRRRRRARLAGTETAKGMEDFAKAMQGMAAAMAGAPAGGKPVDPVSFRDLQTALPDVSGWTMDKPKGERMTSPIAFSQTETQLPQRRRPHRGEDRRLGLPADAGGAVGDVPGGRLREGNDDGYEKSTTVAGHPGFEKWNDRRKDGELNLVVAKRFLVSVEGDRLADMKLLHDFAGRVDFGKLAALGK